MIGYN